MSTLLKIDCADKLNHHLDGLAPTRMPIFPSKILACGRSGSGKGSTVKQLLLTAVPPYDKIFLIHYAPESTDEWHDCDLSAKFTVDSWPDDAGELLDRKLKNAVVCDELAFEGMSRRNIGKIDRLVNFTCSHMSCSAFILQQNLTSVPPSIRRACMNDWLIYWPGNDNASNQYVSRMTGHDMKALKRLCETKYDSITLDGSGNGPALRLNLFTEIKDEEDNIANESC